MLVLKVPSGSDGGGLVAELGALTMCEIELGPERCPGKPDLIAGRPRIFFDNHDKADTNVDRCMRRASEYAAACSSKQPVAARFYKGREVLRSVVHK